MTREEFLTNAYNRIATPISENVLLYTKNVCQIVKKLPKGQEEVTRFKNLEEAYEKAVIDGKPLKDIVNETSEDDMFGREGCDDYGILFPRE